MSAGDADSRLRVAAFDVDGTLTQRDCVVPFLRRVGGAAVVAGRLIARPDRSLAALARRDRDTLKALAARAAFRGKRVAEVEREAEVFAGEVRAAWMRPDTGRILEQHLRRGDSVVLVSASFELYLRPLAAELGDVAVIGTRLDVVDGCFTGDLAGPNCRGPEKVARLHSWLDANHGGRAQVHVTAYGDSAGDRELLLDADDAHWVGAGAAPSWFRSGAA